MRKILISLLLIGVLVSPLSLSFAQRKTTKPVTPAVDPVKTAAERITAAELKDILYFIAADEMEGRDTPSRGLDTAANFIAYHLAEWGLKPAGDDGTYFQRIALRRNRIDPAKTVAEFNGRKLTFGDDFLSGQIAGTASGSLVYVGNGYVIKSKEVDSYKGVDVKDKIMIVTGLPPKGVTNRDFQNKKEGEDFETPQGYGGRHGAKGIISVPNFQTIANWNAARQGPANARFQVEKFMPQQSAALPTITVSAGLLNALFASEKSLATAIFNGAAAQEPTDAFDLNASKKFSFTIVTSPEQARTQNVVAILEGSDPILKNEYVAIGAHYDHVGVRAGGGPGDNIFNGADDDGSGTTGVLAIADALAHGPRPKRSVIFVWHCGEEKGLWGSQYFTSYPTVPLNQVVTQLNIDMIGRSKKEGDTLAANKDLSGPNQIYVIGSRMMSTELGDLSDRVNKSYLNLEFDFRYDDPKDTNRFFFRSDHFNYAQKGVPIIFYFDGVHEDYHRAGDSPDKIDYVKMEKVSRTIFMTLMEVANLAKRPVVDKQLPQELRRN
jgi:hypothetical protein